MMLVPLRDRGIRLVFEPDEASIMDQLLTQLVSLLQTRSSTHLDPDPLLASLEIGGSDEAPDDPALARLLPNAYESEDDANAFRSVSEQGILNRKLQDALAVSTALGLSGDPFGGDSVEVEVVGDDVFTWSRVITSLRLAIAARAGIDSEADHIRLASDEEAQGSVMVYDWLAAILENLMSVAEVNADQPPRRDP